MSGSTLPININNSNLLLYYPFDTNLLNYASGTGVNDATIANVSITNDDTALTTGCASFPGTSNQVFKTPNIQFTSAGITFCFWVKFLNLLGYGSCVVDFASGIDVNNVIFGALSDKSFYIKVNNPSTSASYTNANTGYSPDYTWHHFVFTVASTGGWTLYLDGAVVNMTSINGYAYSAHPSVSLLTSCLIGGNNQSSITNYASMRLNQFLLFNRVLTATEISYLYNFPSLVSFSSAATTATLPTSYDFYSFTPTFLQFPITVSNATVTYNSLNYGLGTPYYLKSGTTIIGTNTRIAPKTHLFYPATTPNPGYLIAADISGNLYIQTTPGAGDRKIYVISNYSTLATTITISECYMNWAVDTTNNILYCAGATTIGKVNLWTYAVTTFTPPTGGIYGIAIGPDGFLYGTTRTTGSIIKMNASTGSYTTIYTSASLSFKACDFDSNGYLYCITNDTNGYIYKFDTNGNSLGLFATINNGTPNSLTCDKSTNSIYVSVGNVYIYKVLSSGTFYIFATPVGFKSNIGAMYGIYYDPFTTHLLACSMTTNNSAKTFYAFNTKGPQSSALTFNIPSAYITSSSNVFQLYDPSSVAFGTQIILNVVCFREGTLIRCLDASLKREVYVPVEHLTTETYVKTHASGYKRVEVIGHTMIYNPNSNTKIDNRLFVYRAGKTNPTLFEDLYVTGNHCALVNDLSDDLKTRVKEHMGDIYETEGHYRLPACLDERAEAFCEPGEHRIWHFAMEHDDVYANYGVLANGLLMESASIDYLRKHSKMTLT